MGQQSLILVFMTTLLLSGGVVLYMQEQRSSSDTTTNQFIGEHALNVANSGINLAISRVRQEKTWRTGFTNLAVDNGNVSVSLVDIGKDSVRITASGRYSDSVRTVIAVVKLASVLPEVNAALSVFGDSVVFQNSGKSFQIDGRDYKSNGSTLTSNQPVWGLGVQLDKIDTYVTNTIVAGKVASNVMGKTSTPSVGTFASDSLSVIFNMFKNLATVTIPPGKYAGNGVLGTLAAPEIVYVPGDLQWNGNTSGAGVLVVDGHLQFSGTVQWQGIVISRASGTYIDFGSSGNPRVIGAALIGNTNALNLTTVKVNGNPSALYSSEAIATVMQNLNLNKVNILSYYE